MVRNRVRKTEKGNFSEETMRDAVNLVNQGMSLRKAARQTGLNPSTVFRYVQKKNKAIGEEVRMKPNYQVRQIFTLQQEQTLRDYIVTCARVFYGLTTFEIRRIAFQMADINSIQYPEKWKNEEMAGVEWLYGFMKRHPMLSVRTPEGCSLSRATAFNEHNVKIFFDNLAKVYGSNPTFADGTRVYNLDETATTTVQKPPKVVAERGIKQVNKCTSAERGVLVTTCCIVNATGNTIPPIMVFPRVHFKHHMISGAPSGTLGLANPSGWMTKQLFVEVIQHFIKHTQCSKIHPALLLLDNHESHLHIKALDLAKDNGVTVLTFPPHSTNKMQPLDVGIYKPFKTYYNMSVDNWMMKNPGKTLSIYEIAECVNYAHQRAMTPATIIAAIKKTGIFPYDQNVFSDIDIDPALKKDNPTGDGDNPFNPTSSATTPSTSSFLSPAEFIGFPKAKDRQTSRTGRRKGKSIIATSTPEKDAIAERENIKVNPIKKRAVTRKILPMIPSSSESSDDEMGLPDSDSSEEYMEEVQNEDHEFEDLQREPTKGDYVLVEFMAGKKKILYVGEIVADKDKNNEFVIDFLRKSNKIGNHFYKPQVTDISVVSLTAIKQILPKPTFLGQTSRQNSYMKFGLTFGSLNIH